MTTHLTTASKGREEEPAEFSFFDALSFDPKQSSTLISWEELQQPATLAPPIPPKPSVPEKDRVLPEPATTSNTQLNRSETTSRSKMAILKAQAQCLERCHKTTAQIDRIAIRFLESLTSERQLPHGMNNLAHDFIDTCQILFAIEAGLGEYNRSGKSFPGEMISELEQKFRVTQADFQVLEQMLGKHLGPSSLKRSLGKLFGDNDIQKIITALGKTRESLRMSSLVFQWSLGQETIEREYGIGYTGLAAALDRLDHKQPKNTNGNTPQPNSNAPQPQPAHASPPQSPGQAISSPPLEFTDSQRLYQQQQMQYQQHQSRPWSDRSSSMNHENHNGRVTGIDSRVPLSPSSPLNPYHVQPLSSDPRYHSGQPTPLSSIGSNFKLADDNRSSLTHITEPDGFLDEIAGIDLGPSKVVRLRADPSSMPRSFPRHAAEPDSSSTKAALLSAVHNKDYKLMEQMLNRGITPSTLALREAIAAHDEEGVRLLLYFGADPNGMDREGNTPLFISIHHSFLLAATLLLKYGADPDLAAGPELDSPLATAVTSNMVGFSHLLLSYNGNVNHVNVDGVPLLTSAIKKKTPKQFIDLILGYGAEPNAKSREGKTALFEALQIGRTDIVTSLLDNGADPNLPGPKHMLWPSTFHPACLSVLLAHGADHKKCPGIMELAASTNNIESVRILLKAGVDPNVRKDGIYTPLCTAIRDDRSELVQLLLASGADPNVKASEYPCFKCVTHDRVHFLPILVAAGGKLSEPKGILETAVSVNNIEALNWLLDQGVNPNDKSPQGMSPLTTAIREDRIEMVDLLLMRGADPHMRGQDWPLCIAVTHPPILKRLLTVVPKPQAFKGVMEMAVTANQLESVKLLLAAGVSVEDKNGGVFSPLTTALRENRREIVHFLLNGGGADVNAPGEHLPVVKALRRFHGEDTEMLELLLEHGADPNKMYRGWNGIMQAVENGDVEVLQMVSDKAGVDLEAKDEMGKNAVDIAAERGWNEAVKILNAGDIRKRSRKH